MNKASNSSYNAPVFDLNLAIEALHGDLAGIKDYDIEILYIGFSREAQVLQDFTSVHLSSAPAYIADGDATDYSAAVSLALNELDDRRSALRKKGIEVNQPWIVLVSDGKPNQVSVPGFELELESRIKNQKLVMIPVAVGGGDALRALSELSPEQKPVEVQSDSTDSLSFKEVFDWIGDSLVAGKPLPFDEAGDDVDLEG